MKECACVWMSVCVGVCVFQFLYLNFAIWHFLSLVVRLRPKKKRLHLTHLKQLTLKKDFFIFTLTFSFERVQAQSCFYLLPTDLGIEIQIWSDPPSVKCQRICPDEKIEKMFSLVDVFRLLCLFLRSRVSGWALTASAHLTQPSVFVFLLSGCSSYPTAFRSYTCLLGNVLFLKACRSKARARYGNAK